MNVPEWNSQHPEVPVDKDGNWIPYPSYRTAGWETIHQPFYAELVVDHMETGRSSKIVVLKDVTSGKTYPMFVSDLVKGLQSGSFKVEPRSDGGRLIGHWTGSKRGANYGIKSI